MPERGGRPERFPRVAGFDPFAVMVALGLLAGLVLGSALGASLTAGVIGMPAGVLAGALAGLALDARAVRSRRG